MIKQQQLYSKTPLAHKIVRMKQFNKIKEKNIDFFIGKLNESNLNHGKTVADMPGTLGWGLYAFDLKKNAKDFKGSDGDVICYEVEYNDDRLLDLWKDQTCMRLLDDFTNDKSVKEGLKAYKKYKNSRNNDKSIQQSDTGIIIELFIKSIKKSFNKETDIVRMATKNNFKNNYNINLYNSVEYCIKNNNIIKEETLKIS